jgi:hypothetical protein
MQTSKAGFFASKRNKLRREIPSVKGLALPLQALVFVMQAAR